MSEVSLMERYDTMHRLLQSAGNQGRTVLTVLYLCVLGLCFVVPVFYYFRMHCEERHARQLRELELAGITQALEQSQNVHREESRAARRKFRDERKARIKQLFVPVQMELQEANFPHLRETKQDTHQQTTSSTNDTNIDQDIKDTKQETDQPDSKAKAELLRSVSVDPSTGSIDEDQLFVEVPSPGFQLASASLVVGRFTHRLVPNVCSICLCNYNVGNTVVWSSNEACEHVFHENCILQWLMKQREGPLCPCCRRDFVLDPYDIEDLDAMDLDGEIPVVDPNTGIPLLISHDTGGVESHPHDHITTDREFQQETQMTINMEEALSSAGSSNDSVQRIDN